MVDSGVRKTWNGPSASDLAEAFQSSQRFGSCELSFFSTAFFLSNNRKKTINKRFFGRQLGAHRNATTQSHVHEFRLPHTLRRFRKEFTSTKKKVEIFSTQMKRILEKIRLFEPSQCLDLFCSVFVAVNNRTFSSKRAWDRKPKERGRFFALAIQSGNKDLRFWLEIQKLRVST